jgi:hypothetical protein
VGQGLLHADAEGGQQDGAFHALGVHHRDAGVPVAVFGPDGLELAEQLQHVGALGVAPAEVLVHDAGRRHRVEGGVRDELVHLAPDQQAGLAVDLRPLHGALAVLRLDVTGERVQSLVVVVIAIKKPERKLCGHSRALRRQEARHPPH